MKKLLFIFLALLSFSALQAKKYPEIKFEKTTIELGTFSMDEPVQKCVFKFTNTGKAKLVINQVHTSCGCTVADYPKDFISPGGTGEITITYNGAGKMPGRFKKSIQVFTNSKDEMVRIYISGTMNDIPVTKK
ncbi:MAG: DUF1573 domain-containing protein [Bacteroidaceae bacterium]|nr:DUF1573 domain-containing protein [Bacteroidaceae bacterium]